MLIIDIAINPTRGIPFEIERFGDFIIEVDPGIRFLRLCHAVREKPSLLKFIKDYSYQEYIEVAEILTEACDYDHPLEALRQVASWTEVPEMETIMLEMADFDFKQENIIVRILAAQFVDFCSDKLRSPQFFCWPGACMSGDRANGDFSKLFLRHLSLFADRAEAQGVYPREKPGVPPENLVKSLTNFYGHIVLCDLTRQLILREGPFVYEYAWLLTRTAHMRWKRPPRGFSVEIMVLIPTTSQNHDS